MDATAKRLQTQIKDHELNSDLNAIAVEIGFPWDRTKLARAILSEAVREHRAGRRTLPPPNRGAS